MYINTERIFWQTVHQDVHYVRDNKSMKNDEYLYDEEMCL